MKVDQECVPGGKSGVRVWASDRDSVGDGGVGEGWH